MPCETIRDANGNAIGIACSRGSQRKRCKCGKPSTKLCDFPLKGSKEGQTCDAPLCERCAHHVGKDTDYCPPHARLAGRGDG